MLDNKNNITLYIREVAKRVILESQYPRDVDPSSVKLTVPYKTGIIATIQDIQDAISKINIERKCVMEEIKFESLNELFNRLYPAFNTKVCELKRSGINVSEVKLWNYLKTNKWSNSKNLTLYDMVSDILNLSKSDFEGEKNDDI